MMRSILADSLFFTDYNKIAKSTVTNVTATDMHLHTTFSDGINTPEEMIIQAIENRLERIAIIDHVWKTSPWVDDFVKEIEGLKNKYKHDIDVYSGIEAKVINLHGDIDAKSEFVNSVDIVFAAIHRIPKGEGVFLTDLQIKTDKKFALKCWTESIMGVLCNQNVDIIAHPTAVLKRHQIRLPRSMKEIIAHKAAENDKAMEINVKYCVPDRELLHCLIDNKIKFLFGSDSHSTHQIHKRLR